jgi:hypothetical protein
MNNMLSQVVEFVPQQQPQGFVPTELNGPLVGQPTTPQVQAPTNDFDDEDKLSLLCLEFNWSAEDDPLRPVIIKEMKEIKDGRELVDELKKIEKKMNLSNTISSQLELELSAPEVALDTCEPPTPSHVPEQTSKSSTEAAVVEEGKVAEIEEEDRSQTLEKQDSQLEFTSDFVDDPIPITPEDKEYEVQVGMSIVVQDLDETGLFDPLNGMFPTELSSIVLRYMIPLLKVERNHDLPKLDNAYSVIDNAHVQNHVSHNPHAIIMLENSCLDNAHFCHNDNCYPDYDTMLPDPYHSHHVLYCY